LNLDELQLEIKNYIKDVICKPTTRILKENINKFQDKKKKDGK
jgi:hypothetical protein